jgi:hypothetical protein
MRRYFNSFWRVLGSSLLMGAVLAVGLWVMDRILADAMMPVKHYVSAFIGFTVILFVSKTVAFFLFHRPE